ncbi:MAG: STY4851/ECs_5259 family protein [Brucella anthropi]
MTVPLSPSASIGQLENSFEAARGDYEQLRRIADALQHHDAPGAQRLRIKVVAEMFRLKRETIAIPPSPSLPPASTPLTALLSQFGLDAPDERPLHRYRLGAEGYEQLTALLRQRAARLSNGNMSDAALLVLWASAWFRREYGGGIRKYRELGVAIGATLEEREWPPLIEHGLKWWKRPVVKRASGRHWLLTIAVEGGFPVRVLQAGEGWLSRYLNEVVGRLLGITDDPSPDDAFTMADAAKQELRDTYRQEAFIALAADLALAIVKLRRVAETAAPSLAPSTVLDQVRPGWRDELPIAADTDAARALVDGMLAAKKIARGLSGGAGCVRVLRRGTRGWNTGLRLSLGGELKANALAELAVRGTRLGVHPYGVLARALGEELAFLDPPGEDGDSWRLRPLTRRTELDDVPLAARVEVLIQSPNGAAHAMLWPGGGSERSDVLTFEIDAEDAGGPTTLVLAAQGSASLRAERVVVTAPADWSVRWEDETLKGVPASIGATGDGRGLWFADRPVLVESKDGGLLYCVQTGVEEELRDRIGLDGQPPRGFDSADDVSLFAGLPTVTCYRGRTSTKPADNELLWRRTRGDPWQELARSRLPVGAIDIMWRDARTRFVRDRVRAAIVPQSARVIRERDGEGWRYSFQGFGELTIAPEPATGLNVDQRSDNVFALSFRSNPHRRVIFVLRIPNSTRTIRIAVPFPLRDGIAHWNGRIVPPGSEITPAELAELVAFGEGKLTLCCEFKNTERDYPAHYTLGEGELGLRPLADRVRRDLAAAGIDAWVALSIGDGAVPWRIKLFDREVRCVDGAASIVKPGLVEEPMILAGRSVATPCEEHCLAAINLEDVLNQRSIPLPEGMTGAWWVYLRSDRAVRSRPSIVSCVGETAPIGDGLAATVAIAAPSLRQTAIVERLNVITGDLDGAADDIKWLSKLIGSLDGLPASTFDVLTALSDAPIVLARLLLAADDSAQGSIWRLEAELPFLWATLPLSAWNAAANTLGHSVMRPLLTAGWELARAAPVGKQIIDSAAARTGNLDPVIGTMLAAAGLLPKPSSTPSIRDAAQGYVRRTFDRGDMAIGLPKQTSVFRTPELDPYLPDWFKTTFDLMHLEALDAPIAAAIAARTDKKLTRAQLRRCKEAMVADPVYFAEGITAELLGTER